jgi:hypothetical protein
MIRVWGKWAAMLILIFLVGITGAHVLPTDQPDIQAFNTIFLESCATPCLMGIRPQNTTLTEALAILNNHEWVTHVSSDSNPGLITLDAIVIWEWSGAQPGIIDGSRPGSLLAKLPLGSAQHIVERINVLTTLPMYDLQRVLQPESNGYLRYLSTDGVVIYGEHIVDKNTSHSITLSTQLRCPAHLINYRDAVALVGLSGQSLRGNNIMLSSLYRQCRS